MIKTEVKLPQDSCNDSPSKIEKIKVKKGRALIAINIVTYTLLEHSFSLEGLTTQNTYPVNDTIKVDMYQ